MSVSDPGGAIWMTLLKRIMAFHPLNLSKDDLVRCEDQPLQLEFRLRMIINCWYPWAAGDGIKFRL